MAVIKQKFRLWFHEKLKIVTPTSGYSNTIRIEENGLRGARNTGWNVNNTSLNLTTTDGCGLLESDLEPRRGEGRGRKHG